MSACPVTCLNRLAPQCVVHRPGDEAFLLPVTEAALTEWFRENLTLDTIVSLTDDELAARLIDHFANTSPA